MPRLFQTARKPAGLAPGTLQYVGERKIEKTRIRVIDYDESRIEERELAGIEECLSYRDSPTVTWINVDGLHDVDLIEKLGLPFGLHPLVLEDIVNTHQRPKVEEHRDHLYIVCRMVYYNHRARHIDTEQFSLVLGRNWVLSFQEKVGDVFEPVRERLRGSIGRIRGVGADYLAYALLDAVVDHHFVLLENIGDQIEALEEKLLEDPGPELLRAAHRFKREMILLRRSVWPLREVVTDLERLESDLFAAETANFLRDLHDHTLQVAEVVESFRDLLAGLQDLYLSSVSNRMNEVMKVLTIIATIFVPLTFVAGIYGMNFQFMPELGWKWGYVIFWALIAGIAVTMLTFFRRKRWL